MFKKMLLLTIAGAVPGTLSSVIAEPAKVTSVICSASSPRIQGFELIRVSRKKNRGNGAYNVTSHSVQDGGILFRGTYDVPLHRLKATAVQVDEDGEEGQFLASVDAVVDTGEHLRVIFMNPVGPEKTLEKVELVCNVVSH